MSNCISRSIQVPVANDHDAVAAVESYIGWMKEPTQFVHARSVILLDAATRIGTRVRMPGMLHGSRLHQEDVSTDLDYKEK
ncbi:MAG: hypothetical protein EOO38_21965 [Cytophagaceae bacterium]|nr:MAG: hypothetical protein EOO38_21965 [Cytophagaceae bacterium]